MGNWLRGEMQAITENTVLPLSLVGVLFGGIVWLTQIHYTAEAAVENTNKNRRNVETIQIYMQSIDRRLSRIEGKLNISED